MGLGKFEELVAEARQYEKERIQPAVQAPGEFVINHEDSIQFDANPNPEQLINYYWKVRKLTAAVYYEQAVLESGRPAEPVQAPGAAAPEAKSKTEQKKKQLGSLMPESGLRVPSSGYASPKPATENSKPQTPAFPQAASMSEAQAAKSETENRKPETDYAVSKQEEIAGSSAELYRRMIDEKYSGRRQISTEQADVIRKIEQARGFQIAEMRRYDEIEALPDFKLVEYARLKALDLYNRLAVGAITPDEFRRLLRGKMAKERGLDPAYFERPKQKRKMSIEEEARAFSEAGGPGKK